MRLIMLGTGPFAVPTLRALAGSSHSVIQVVSRPPQGRTKQPSPVQRTAEELQLDAWCPPTVNSSEAQARLNSLMADLLVVCDYGEILKPETLATARLGGINLHGSLLPKYRGAAPVQWAMLHGDAETGNSIIQMTPGLDAGPLLSQQRTPIDPDEDAAQLEARLAVMGASEVLRVVGDLKANTATAAAQDASQTSKAPRLKKELGVIDWTDPAQKIKNQVRALRPWPRAYTFWHSTGGVSMRLNLDRVQVVDVPQVDGNSPPPAGSVLESSPRFIIATGSGALEVLELQPAGKRSMPAGDFLRGNRVAVGERLGPG